MRRGRRKLRLTAAHTVTAKKPNLLRTNLTRSPPCPAYPTDLGALDHYRLSYL
jgi:hypothetical protein